MAVGGVCWVRRSRDGGGGAAAGENFLGSELKVARCESWIIVVMEDGAIHVKESDAHIRGVRIRSR